MGKRPVSLLITALHGFLGRPSDFDHLGLQNIYAPDLFLTGPDRIDRWAKRFNRTSPKNSVLLGYSMGGRLALHCLLDAPTRYRAAIILAAHPGLSCPHNRSIRRDEDRNWALKFLQEPWAKLMDDWNDQGVLNGCRRVARHEHHYQRRALASCLRHFSLGEQADMSPAISRLELPILWMMPENESIRIKNVALLNPSSEIVLLKRANHRFLFEQPKEVSNIIKNFLFRLYFFNRSRNIIHTFML